MAAALAERLELQLVSLLEALLLWATLLELVREKAMLRALVDAYKGELAGTTGLPVEARPAALAVV